MEESTDFFCEEIHDCGQELSLSSWSRNSKSSRSSRSSSSSVEHLHDFSNVLRESLSTRQQQQRDDEMNHPQRNDKRRIQWNALLFSKNQQTRSSPVIANDEEKSLATVVTSYSMTDQMEPSETSNNSFGLWTRSTHLLVSWRIKLLSWFLIPNNEERQKDEEHVEESTIYSPSYFRWNWDRIVKFLAFLVVMETILVVGLLVAFLSKSHSSSR
jgi:hypothetical protein